MGTWTEEGKMVLDKLESLESKVNSLDFTLNDMRIELAVHNVKISQSSAFFGALSGMVVAIITAAIINYTSNPKETETPRIVYKQELDKAKFKKQ